MGIHYGYFDIWAQRGFSAQKAHLCGQPRAETQVVVLNCQGCLPRHPDTEFRSCPASEYSRIFFETSTNAGITIHVKLEEGSWDEALALLGEVFESRGLAPRHLVVCGGAALRAGGFVSRVTRDVDVLAERGEVDGEISPAWPFPDDVKQAIADVAAELKLPADWLNASTSMLIGRLENLPPDFWRGGLIHLKIRAAIKRREPRDRDDVLTLSPTKEECLGVVQWMEHYEALDRAERDRLADLMKELGHE